MTDVRIYAAALAATDVQAIFNTSQRIFPIGCILFLQLRLTLASLALDPTGCLAVIMPTSPILSRIVAHLIALAMALL